MKLYLITYTITYVVFVSLQLLSCDLKATSTMSNNTTQHPKLPQEVESTQSLLVVKERNGMSVALGFPDQQQHKWHCIRALYVLSEYWSQAHEVGNLMKLQQS